MAERPRVFVELSHPAAVFLRAAVAHMNQRNLLPEGNREALQTSAWLEEIEAKTREALNA